MSSEFIGDGTKGHTIGVLALEDPLATPRRDAGHRRGMECLDVDSLIPRATEALNVFETAGQDEQFDDALEFVRSQTVPGEP